MIYHAMRYRTTWFRLRCPDCAGDGTAGICGPVDTYGENDHGIYREGDMMTCQRCQGTGRIYFEVENE
jgi:hypothetical protein